MSLYEEIVKREAKIAIIGMGYVGMPLAVAFAKKAEVIGFDINKHKIAQYISGIDPTNEVGNRWCGILACCSPRMKPCCSRPLLHRCCTPQAATNATWTPWKVPALVGQSESYSIVVFESTVYPGVTEASVSYTGERIGPCLRTGFQSGLLTWRINR